jgi:hypothetical protein
MFYATQVGTAPPRTIIANRPEAIPESYALPAQRLREA